MHYNLIIAQLFLLLLLILLLGHCSAWQGNWPSPQSLLAFWPLDGESATGDIANGRTLQTSDAAKVMRDIAGPFGKPRTSYTVTRDNQDIGGFTFKARLTEFTVSFFFYTQGKATSGLIHFCQEHSFSLAYEQPNNLGLYRHDGSDILIGRVMGMLPVNSWNFVAVTYSEKEQLLSVFDSNGVLKGLFQSVTILQPAQVVIGRAWGPPPGLKTTDAVACVMVYNTVLQPDEIAELPFQCETKGRGVRTTTKMLTITETIVIDVTGGTGGTDDEDDETTAITSVVAETSVIEISTLTTTTTTTKSSPVVTNVQPWPRPQSLLGFWPLDAQYQFNDVSENRYNTNTASSAKLVPGPFGDQETAAEPLAQSQHVMGPILDISNSNFVVNGSFTVTLFFSRGSLFANDESGGIFEFQDKFGSQQSFQFRYENSTTIEVSANDFTVGHYTMIQPKAAWTFIAFVFDASTAMFTVYGKHGMVAPAEKHADIRASRTFNNNGIKLGYASRWQQGLREADAVSCLMVYSAALNAEEIKQARDSCRIIHGATPCGSPKLAMSPIPVPASPKATTVPKPGQFPFVASLRLRERHICSANIIDSFWLVTSSQCFLESTNPADFTVYVGEYNLGVTESYTMTHQVAKIILPTDINEHPRNPALIQTLHPIDFTSNYANDVCLYREEMSDEMRFDSLQFVVGWGVNGRSPVVSATLPRYVFGLFLANEQCEKAWATNYTAGSDFCFFSDSHDKNVPCKGDEGSPLLVQASGDPKMGTSDRLVQIGWYYMRDTECAWTKPGVFANGAQFSNWISEKIACTVPGYFYPEKCPQ